MDDRTSVVNDQIALAMHSWKSLYIKSEEQYNTGSKGNGDVDRIELEYIETAEGWRFYDKSVFRVGGGGERETAYYDGKIFYELRYDKDDWRDKVTYVLEKDSFLNEKVVLGTDRPWPFCFYYVGKVPLDQAIRQATRLEDRAHDSVRCDVYLFENVGFGMVKQDLVYYLKKESSLPVVVQGFAAGSGKLGRPIRWQWSATKYNTVNGVEYVSSSTAQHFGGGLSEDPPLMIEIQQMEYDRPFARTTFKPVAQPGVVLYNEKTKTQRKVPGGTAPRVEKSPPVPEGVPLVADPPSNLVSNATVVGLISLGLALLATAVFVVWKRRGRG